MAEFEFCFGTASTCCALVHAVRHNIFLYPLPPFFLRFLPSSDIASFFIAAMSRSGKNRFIVAIWHPRASLILLVSEGWHRANIDFISASVIFHPLLLSTNENSRASTSKLKLYENGFFGFPKRSSTAKNRLKMSCEQSNDRKVV